MSSRKKKEEGSVKEQEEIQFEEESKNLLEAIVEEAEQRQCQESDPFDYYVGKVSSRACGGNDLFQTRFVKGYLTLLEKLKNEQNTSHH